MPWCVACGGSIGPDTPNPAYEVEYKGRFIPLCEADMLLGSGAATSDLLAEMLTAARANPAFKGSAVEAVDLWLAAHPGG